jgi:hypothetical protein
MPSFHQAQFLVNLFRQNQYFLEIKELLLDLDDEFDGERHAELDIQSFCNALLF